MLFFVSYDDLNPEAVIEGSSQSELLVPIRIDLEMDGQKLRETFTWNKNGLLF
jgi:SWI/SNF-related matrix-associated actin-dependent regulator of chromatin subfamily B protein 1